jgi:hypothetical protein
MTDDQIISSLKENFGTELTASDIKGFCAAKNLSYPTVTRRLEQFKTNRGRWNLEVTSEAVETLENTFNSPSVRGIDIIEAVKQNLIPEKDDTFVKFGNFTDIKKIIQSRLFYPTFITGLSGNGKTFGVEQACAQTGRELIRVNITIETDEDDLIGGFRLFGGSTVWKNGPVIEALERGAILLLDEIDLASNKIMCLQSVLEGKGVFLKKIGKFVKPAPGFNVIATANTKGKGSDDGRFIGTNVLNAAFLDRFAITLEQEYPTSAIEQKILQGIADSIGILESGDFIKKLCDWSDIIRKTFYDGGIDEIVSTRRLVHILKAYSIFNSKEKSIKYSISGFDDETKQAFLELYDKVDADFTMPAEGEHVTCDLDQPAPF